MLRREFDRTGRRGPVGGRERVLCLPVAVAVHGRALACMRPRGEQRGDGRRGTALRRRSCPLSAVTGSRPPQDTPARAARGATDAGKTPSARAGVLAREKEPRATRQVHCGRVTETDGLKMTLKLNFLNIEQ